MPWTTENRNSNARGTLVENRALVWAWRVFDHRLNAQVSLSGPHHGGC